MPRCVRKSVAAFFSIFVLLFAVFAAACGSSSSDKPLRLATTTSVVDSGLLSTLLPAFEKKTGRRVEVMALGSGKALSALREGEADVAVTHAPELELAAVEKGEAKARTPFMRNAFVIVGPKDSLPIVAGAGDFRDVLRAIAKSGKKFVSRGDESGTHTREKALWKAANLDPEADFIIKAKAGMAETLKRASDDGAFALTDKGTFLAKRNDVELAIVFQGDDELNNVYSVVEPAADAKSDREGAQGFANFVRSPDGKAVIGGFGVEALGEPLFTPEP
ncbi:MAG: substrate-binding domain-containing protein [Polyangiaceae bacterium]|nr:substrate-binding domain-containing protein [Polyangiaceae bacterium]